MRLLLEVSDSFLWKEQEKIYQECSIGVQGLDLN